jgi:E3 ubiquitin-protein ligase RAD18
LNYGLINEKTLRKKMADLGIPSWGSKTLLQRRYSEFVNIHNANADSTQPRLKWDLLKQLDLWERTQGGQAPNPSGSLTGPSAVMRKDFNGAEWAHSNKSDFDRLIAEARRKRQSPKQETSTDEQAEHGEQNAEDTAEVPGSGTKKLDRQTQSTVDTPTNVESQKDAQKPAPSPPPYLKHEDSLKRAVEKIHSGQSLQPPQSATKKNSRDTNTRRPLTLSLQPGSTVNGTASSNTHHSAKSDEQTSPISFPLLKDGEKVPMLELPQHPIKDIDGDTAV